MGGQQPKKSKTDRAAELAQVLTEALVRERIIPRFVDSYVVERGRYALQVHAALYRDLLTLLQREALLAASVQIVETATRSAAGKQGRKAPAMTRKEAAAFRQRFLAAMTRQQHWNVTTALEFQSDLRLYENILARAQATQRIRKPFEAANHPFVDRCAFMLDSSFLENARVAASRALSDLEVLVEHVSNAVFSVSTAPRGK
jgi:hypothetical protein